ncbi:phage tail tape measure protein, partial [Candidatus Pacearchaeota archaeon]|nr:phage tail tape measure protein [Candidatus Pacearchaeota archaeon]
MAKRFSIEAVFKAVDKMSAPVSRMQNRIGKFTRKMDRGLRKVNKSVGRFAQKMKKGALIVGASLAIIGAGLLNVINTGAQFDQTLVNAAAKFPGEIRKGTKEFILLEDAARQVGRTTEFTAIQSAEALNFLAMAGFNAEQSVKALPGVVDLATVAQSDLATATDIATDSLGAFGLMTKDAGKLGKNLARINDVIAKTSTTANTNIMQLFEAVK